MTWYTFFKSVHVVAAVIWVGGGFMIQAFALRIMRTGDARRQAAFAKDTEVVARGSSSRRAGCCCWRVSG